MSAYSDRIIADGASHYWRLGETSGTTAADLVGSAPGTISGGVTLGAAGAIADGNTAITFNGTTGRIAATAIVIPAAWTVEAWIKTTASDTRAVVSTREASSTVLVFLGIDSGKLFVYSNAGGSVTGVRLINDGEWHHLVYVFQEASGVLPSLGYVDGSLDRSQVGVSFPAAPTTNALDIGWDFQGAPAFNGGIDEVAIYPRALTAPEIAAHYALRTATAWVLGPGDKALMQARSGIARSGATRSNYYQGSAVITIDNGSGPIDITAHVVYNGWSLSLNLNDEVDTASIALLPSCPFVPVPHSQVKIGLGASNNLEFAGIVLTVQRTRKTGPDPRFWYDLTCIDWTVVLDAHLIVADYPQQSATTTILDLIARFTRGGISTAGVPAGLPSVPGLSIINERPSTVLRRITNKLGGGFYLDANRVLRVWSSTIPSPMQEPAPVPLTDHLATLHTFRMTEDASQQRTRVWAEGHRTTVPIAVPFWSKANSVQLTVPLADPHLFDYAPDQQGDLVRIGSMLAWPSDRHNPTVDPAANPPGTLMTAAVAAGATVLMVESTAMLPEYGWVSAGGQTLWYQKYSFDPTHAILLPPSPDYGSLQAPLGAGAAVVLIPDVSPNAKDRTATTPGTPPLQFLVDFRAQPQGSPAVLSVMVEDATIAATIATREGSDGFYEHIVQDGRWNRDGALGRAHAELTDFASPLLTYEWETDDLNAQPGRMQHIALTEGTPITADVRITNVTVTPLVTGRPPRRQVRATKVQTAGVVDVWVDDPR